MQAGESGDNRFADQIGMAIAPKVRARQFALYKDMLARLQTIHRERLDPRDQTSWDILDYDLRTALRFEAFPGAPAAAGPDGQRPGRPGQLFERRSRPAAEHGQGLPGLPEPPEPARPVDRPGHRQHARRDQARRHAAEGDHGVRPAAVPALGRGQGRGQHLLHADQALPGRLRGGGQGQPDGRLPQPRSMPRSIRPSSAWPISWSANTCRPAAPAPATARCRKGQRLVPGARRQPDHDQPHAGTDPPDRPA